jgi:hypothetical protein
MSAGRAISTSGYRVRPVRSPERLVRYTTSTRCDAFTAPPARRAMRALDSLYSTLAVGRQGSAEPDDLITTALSDVSERLPTLRRRARRSSEAIAPAVPAGVLLSPETEREGLRKWARTPLEHTGTGALPVTAFRAAADEPTIWNPHRPTPPSGRT